MSASLPVDLPETPVNRTQLLKYMKACGFKTVTVDHPPLFTVDDSQNLRGALEGGHTKNLFLKDRKGNHFLLTAQEDSVVNLKTLHKLLGGSGKFSFGNAENMEKFLGVSPGAVTALGVINDRENQVTFALDHTLLEHDKINCHPLTNEATITLKRDDLLAFLEASGHKPIVVDLAQEV